MLVTTPLLVVIMSGNHNSSHKLSLLSFAVFQSTLAPINWYPFAMLL